MSYPTTGSVDHCKYAPNQYILLSRRWQMKKLLILHFFRHFVFVFLFYFSILHLDRKSKYLRLICFSYFFFIDIRFLLWFYWHITFYDWLNGYYLLHFYTFFDRDFLFLSLLIEWNTMNDNYWRFKGKPLSFS